MLPELLAHQASHLIGRRFNSGKNCLDLDPDSAANKEKLMKSGGDAVARITFEEAVSSFNKPSS